MRGPQQYTLGPHAARQVAQATARVERASRSQLPQRRRSIAAVAQLSFAVGSLTAKLNSGSSAGFTFSLGGSGSDTAYDCLLCSGDSLPSGTQVVLTKFYNSTAKKTTWYVIGWRPPAIAFGTLTGTLSKGGSAGITWTIGNTGTGTVYDGGLSCTGDTLPSGATVVAVEIGCTWHVLQASCC